MAIGDFVQHLFERFELVRLVLQFLKVLGHLVQLGRRRFSVALLQALAALAQLLGHFLQCVHLVVHAIQLVELPLQLAGAFQVAGVLTPLDLLLQIAFGLLVAVLQLLQPVLHLFQLPGQLLFLFLGQLIVLQLLLQVLEFLQGLLKVAVFHGFRDLLRRSAGEVLQPIQLLAHLVHAAHLVAAILERLGQVIHLDQRLLVVHVRLVDQFVHAFLQFLEQDVRVLQAFFLGLLLDAFHLLLQLLRTAFHLLGLLRLRVGCRRLLVGHGIRDKD